MGREEEAEDDVWFRCVFDWFRVTTFSWFVSLVWYDGDDGERQVNR